MKKILYGLVALALVFSIRATFRFNSAKAAQGDVVKAILWDDAGKVLLGLTTKGTQGTKAIPTQDFKDSGRTFVTLYADGVTPAIADTAITFVRNVGGTAVGTLTTYAITSGKTLRIQSLCASFTAGAAANIVRVRLRLNTAGACLVSSGLVLPAFELAPNYGTATASEGGAVACAAIPDGLELSGASWNICFSESAVAASGTLTVNLIGYEY